MASEILITGGTGKTGRRLADRLRAMGRAPRVATREPRAADHVRFDWSDRSSFDEALRGVGAVYLVAPPGVVEPLAAMRPLIDFRRPEVDENRRITPRKQVHRPFGFSTTP